jgi:hypothetical protein
MAVIVAGWWVGHMYQWEECVPLAPHKEGSPANQAYRAESVRTEPRGRPRHALVDSKD